MQDTALKIEWNNYSLMMVSIILKYFNEVYMGRAIWSTVRYKISILVFSLTRFF